MNRLFSPFRPVPCTLVLTIVAILSLPLSAGAQIIRASKTLYGRLGAGPSVSETDRATYAVEPFSVNGEVGYQLTRSIGFGLGLTYADYPEASDTNTTMTTLQAVGRWTLFPQERATPYFNVGPQLTLGGDNPAGGLIFGLGVDYMLTRRTSVFFDATAYATLPDDAIDSRDDGRATFDGLGFWGAGVRSTLASAPTPVDLHPIEGPKTVHRGKTVRYTVRTNRDASPPIEYRWHMGDGTERHGLVVEHTYRLEGSYPVTVTASNLGGEDAKTLNVRVEEPENPAHIRAFSADTLTAYTHQLVRFSAELSGSAPLDAIWQFGDNSPPVVERGSHTYARDAYIGHITSDIRQGYVYDRPGTYTVALSAENRFGSDRAEITVEIKPSTRHVVASLSADPCYEPTPTDTVFFAFDQADITADSRKRIRQTASRVAECPNQLVRLDGFADWVGTTDYNYDLSHRRAAAVQDIYESAGVSSDRIVLRGHGELAPPCRDRSHNQVDDPGCGALRRVESVVVMEEVPLAGAQTRVEAPVVSTPAHAVQAERERGEWVISVGWYSTKNAAVDHAQSIRKRLSTSDAPEIHIVLANTDEAGYRVVLGPMPTAMNARATKHALQETIPADAWVYELQRPLNARMVAGQ